jgi:hypothetical protein
MDKKQKHIMRQKKKRNSGITNQLRNQEKKTRDEQQNE